MKKTTLVIMAAGIGSRFGKGIKQLTSFGTSGEIIMDYSIYDALEAGFDRIVFVIRKSLEEDFRSVIGDRIEKHAQVAYAFQEMDDLPDGFTVPEGRVKPWGTGQAILACRNIVKEPFAVINADDYYGKEAFKSIHEYLINMDEGGDGPLPMCMAGFVLKNTLSENGGVTRGICSMDNAGYLTGIRETKNIIKTGDGAGVKADDGSVSPLDTETLVSMNMWGLPAGFIDMLEEGFRDFLSALPGDGTKGEYLLPTIIDDFIQTGRAKVAVLPSHDKWFGVTYQEDIPVVVEEFKKLVERKAYPEKLWK